MAERIFTIFRGPDAGRSFRLADAPLTIGRDAARDVVLHDDRASRLHAKLTPDGDGAILSDAGSSNGTFVNGSLAREQRIEPGDVIIIGGNHLVFGAKAPAAKAEARIEPIKHVLPTLKISDVNFTEILEAVTDAAQPMAEERGIRVDFEISPTVGSARGDAHQLYRGLAGLMAHFLGLWTARPMPHTEVITARAILIALNTDAVNGGFKILITCEGMPVPEKQFKAARNAEAISTAECIAAAHGGSLNLLPSEGAFALMTLPSVPPSMMRTSSFG